MIQVPLTRGKFAIIDDADAFGEFADTNFGSRTDPVTNVAVQGQIKKPIHIFRNNTSGHRGVSFNRASGKWKAQIRKHFLGYFESSEDAADAYLSALRVDPEGIA